MVNWHGCSPDEVEGSSPSWIKTSSNLALTFYIAGQRSWSSRHPHKVEIVGSNPTLRNQLVVPRTTTWTVMTCPALLRRQTRPKGTLGQKGNAIYIRLQPSDKAEDFDSSIRWFESIQPCQGDMDYATTLLQLKYNAQFGELQLMKCLSKNTNMYINLNSHTKR